MNKKRLKISWVEKRKKTLMKKKTENSDEEISELQLLNQSVGKHFLLQAYPTNLKMSSSSDSSDGDDISIYDSSEEEEEDSENSDEEEDSEKSDEEKTPTLDLDSSRKEVKNRLEMPPDDDDDSEMYDLSEEEEEGPSPPPPPPPRCRSKKRKNRTPDSDEEKTPTPDLGSSSVKEVRNWLEMPPDVMSLIFTKVGLIDILLGGAQSVCTAWQKLSKEPHLYRSIDLRNCPDLRDDDLNRRYDPERLTVCAVNRSAGQLVEFSVKYIATDAMLRSITKIRSPLKCLRLVECDNIGDHDVMLMAKKLPLLEELEMLHCYCCKSMIRGFGRYCPQLKSFRLTCTSERFCEKSNGQAFSIAQNMPGLHHLDLFGNPLSDTGLIAILDQCVNLKSLDCRRCFRLTFGEDLFKRCTDRNIDVKLPNDCTVGCGFDTSECDREYTMDGLPLTG